MIIFAHRRHADTDSSFAPMIIFAHRRRYSEILSARRRAA